MEKDNIKFIPNELGRGAGVILMGAAAMLSSSLISPANTPDNAPITITRALQVDYPPELGSHNKPAESQVQKELAEVLNKLHNNPNLADVLERGFKERHFREDLQIYYSIYREVAARYNIPWTLLFAQHEMETGASRKIANSLYVGAGQRDPRPGYWTDEFANESFYGHGLEHLTNVPGQRDPTDAREIATMARILRLKIDSSGSIYGALNAYGAKVDYRFRVFKAFQQALE